MDHRTRIIIHGKSLFDAVWRIFAVNNKSAYKSIQDGAISREFHSSFEGRLFSVVWYQVQSQWNSSESRNRPEKVPLSGNAGTTHSGTLHFTANINGEKHELRNGKIYKNGVFVRYATAHDEAQVEARLSNWDNAGFGDCSAFSAFNEAFERIRQQNLKNIIRNTEFYQTSVKRRRELIEEPDVRPVRNTEFYQTTMERRRELIEEQDVRPSGSGILPAHSKRASLNLDVVPEETELATGERLSRSEIPIARSERARLSSEALPEETELRASDQRNPHLRESVSPEVSGLGSKWIRGRRRSSRCRSRSKTPDAPSVSKQFPQTGESAAFVDSGSNVDKEEQKKQESLPRRTGISKRRSLASFSYRTTRRPKLPYSSAFPDFPDPRLTVNFPDFCYE